jgi:hypothetical protein
MADLSPSGNLGDKRDKELSKAFPRAIKAKGTTGANSKLNRMRAPRLGVDPTVLGSLPGSAASVYPLHDQADYSGTKSGTR